MAPKRELVEDFSNILKNLLYAGNPVHVLEKVSHPKMNPDIVTLIAPNIY